MLFEARLGSASTRSRPCWRWSSSLPARSRPAWDAAKLGLSVMTPRLPSNPYLQPARNDAVIAKVSHMGQLLEKYDGKNVRLGVFNVPNVTYKAIMEKRVTNAMLVVNGATNPRLASGVKLKGVSSSKMKRRL